MSRSSRGVRRVVSALGLLVVLALGCLASSVGARDPATLRIEVFKSRRELRLFERERLVKTCRVGLGTNPVPPKDRQGDRATPEGSYFICRKNPNSRFHLSLGISYPGPLDAERGLAAGLITAQEHDAIVAAHGDGRTPPWNTRLGGEIFVHGHGSQSDWTWGCIALDDSDIEELYRLVPVGTPIAIHP